MLLLFQFGKGKTEKSYLSEVPFLSSGFKCNRNQLEMVSLRPHQPSEMFHLLIPGMLVSR